MPWELQPDGTEIYVMRTPEERWTYIASLADGWTEDPERQAWALDRIEREVRAQERIERLEAERAAEIAARLKSNAELLEGGLVGAD